MAERGTTRTTRGISFASALTSIGRPGSRVITGGRNYNLAKVGVGGSNPLARSK
jgi:hypothetical protein